MEKLIDARELARRLGISTRQVFKLRAMGRLPEPVKLARSTRWREGEIDRFIECGCAVAGLEGTNA